MHMHAVGSTRFFIWIFEFVSEYKRVRTRTHSYVRPCTVSSSCIVPTKYDVAHHLPNRFGISLCNGGRGGGL